MANKLIFKPVMVVEEVTFEKIKDNIGILNALYSVVKNSGNSRMHDIELETQLTLLFNVLTRNELEDLIFKSKLLTVAISKHNETPANIKLNNNEFIMKARKIESVYKNVVGNINEKINKSVLTEVKKNNLLDLKTRYSVLTKEDMLDCEEFTILKVEDNLLYMLENNKVSNDVYHFLYGMYLNTNSIASNIDFNKKIDNNIMGSVLPYIRNYA